MHNIWYVRNITIYFERKTILFFIDIKFNSDIFNWSALTLVALTLAGEVTNFGRQGLGQRPAMAPGRVRIGVFG